MNINVIGAYTTKFGELWKRGFSNLVAEAVEGVLKDANLSIDTIEALFVGNMLSGALGDQEQLGSSVSSVIGVNTPSIKIEGACASGGLAVHQAVLSVLSGQYETVLVVGIAKMTDYSPEKVAWGLMQAASEDERIAGLTFPGLYALMARVHMEEFGTTLDQLAAVAVKNHYHASLNGKAHFPFEITMENVADSPLIADPLRLLDCSPISDGASAVILTAAKSKVKIVASAVATDSIGLAGREDITSIKATKLAAEKAYNQAGIGVGDIDIAEVHDCFTIAEIIALEDLGFGAKGEIAVRIENGEYRLGCKNPIVNTSGGLKASGHPVGATGVKQIVEIVQQLRGQAGKKQVDNAKVGLTHNVGGTGGTCVVHILKS